jgi:hypothetical protein
VTFLVTNIATIVHSFQIDVPGRNGPPISPGQTVSLTVHFTAKGRYSYNCGEPEHDEEYGEYGLLTVD